MSEVSILSDGVMEILLVYYSSACRSLSLRHRPGSTHWKQGQRSFELTLARLSLLTHTRTFIQPSLPQVLLLSRLHRCATFLMMPCIDRVNRSSSSLYMVMKSLVRREGS